MGLRFRRSVRLFPGVRLNFSRSGISTTVGVRGATMTLGPRGTHANVGIPGSGISYRTKVSGPPSRRATSAAPAPVAPPILPSPSPASSPTTDADILLRPGETAIRSADASVLTSSGLGELKRLINEAAVRRGQLLDQVASAERTLSKAKSNLNLARFFIIRIFTANIVPKLVERVQAADEHLELSNEDLNGCFVEIDFNFDDATLGAYAALTRAFEDLATCERIWDITSTATVNQMVERSAASTSVRRSPVRFDFGEPHIVRTSHKVLQLGNVAGRDFQIYPAFLMMRDANHDFALIEYKDFDLQSLRSRFLEEEQVPSDSQVIGHAWKKSNKDGSRDRRFNDNYEIPVVKYGELVLSNPAGLMEAYQFSNYAKSHSFCLAMDAHRRAVALLATNEGPEPAAAGDIVADDHGPEAADVADPVATRALPEKIGNLWLDYIGLALLVFGIGIGSLWLANHFPDLKSPPATAADMPAPAAPVATPKPLRAHHSRGHAHHKTQIRAN